MKSYPFAIALLFLATPPLAQARDKVTFPLRAGMHAVSTNGDSKRSAYRQGQVQARQVCQQYYQYPQMISERMRGPGSYEQDEFQNQNQSGGYLYDVRFRCGEKHVNGLPWKARY